jgi:hypothetical protein
MHITLEEHERAIAGYDDTGTERTPADDRLRAIVWGIGFPIYLVILGIIVWQVVRNYV